MQRVPRMRDGLPLPVEIPQDARAQLLPMRASQSVNVDARNIDSSRYLLPVDVTMCSPTEIQRADAAKAALDQRNFWQEEESFGSEQRHISSPKFLQVEGYLGCAVSSSFNQQAAYMVIALGTARHCAAGGSTTCFDAAQTSRDAAWWNLHLPSVIAMNALGTNNLRRLTYRAKGAHLSFE